VKLGRFARQQLGSAPRHEHRGIDRDAQAAELRPAEHLFERKAAGPLPDHAVELVRRGGLGDEHPRLFLGKDAARQPQRGGHGFMR
jgi:hypothetical protein